MSRIIALTGASGFIGSSLANRLNAAGWHIRALVRPTSLRNHLAGINVEFIEGDLEDQDSLRRLVHGVDAVIHCAGAVRAHSSLHFNRVNCYGVTRLVQAASEQHQAPFFLLISSLAAREPDLSPYAESKRNGEEALMDGAGNMKWAVLRPPAVYGPGDKEMLPLFRMMYRGIIPVLGRFDARFSLIYVEDLAEAAVRLLDSKSSNQSIFELHDGHPNGYGWSDIADIFTRLRGRRVFYVKVPTSVFKLLGALNTLSSKFTGNAPMLSPGKVRELIHPDWVCDNGPLSRVTGWEPETGLEEGLRLSLKPAI